jgi:hypothetical protein
MGGHDAARSVAVLPGDRLHAARPTATRSVYERHRHRFEVNNEYRERLAEGGLIASGVSKDGNLVEIMELRDHPFFVGVQFHPEFRSRPTRPHPLFHDFVEAAIGTLPEGAQRELPLTDAMDRVAPPMPTSWCSPATKPSSVDATGVWLPDRSGGPSQEPVLERSKGGRLALGGPDRGEPPYPSASTILLKLRERGG